MTQQPIITIPILIPIFGLDNSGKSLLCTKLSSTRDEEENHNDSFSANERLAFIPASSAFLMMPQKSQNNAFNNPLTPSSLPCTTLPNLTRQKLQQHLVQRQQKQTDEKAKNRNEKDEAASDQVVTMMASPYQHRTNEMFTPPSASPQHRGALAIVNAGAAARPPSAVAEGSQQEKEEEHDSENHLHHHHHPNFITERRGHQQEESASLQMTPKNKMIGKRSVAAAGETNQETDHHHRQQQPGSSNYDDVDGDFFSPTVVQTVERGDRTLSSSSDSNADGGGGANHSAKSNAVIHLLDSSGSALLRSSWLPILQHAALSNSTTTSSQNSKPKLQPTKSLFVINSRDLFRATFAWTEFLQLVKRAKSSSPMSVSPVSRRRINWGVVLFDADYCHDDDDDDEKLNLQLFQERVVQRFTDSIFEDEDAGRVDFLEASMKDVSQVAKWLLECLS